jgi:hypothetical protein
VQVFTQHTAKPSDCEQFESFAQIAPSGCVPIAAPPAPPLLIEPPVLVEPPVEVEPPVLVEPPVVVAPPMGIVPPLPPDDAPDVPEPPFVSSLSDSESSELHPAELASAARTQSPATVLAKPFPFGVAPWESMNRAISIRLQ